MSLFPIIPPASGPQVLFIDDYEGTGDTPSEATVSLGDGGANGDMIVVGITWNNGGSTSGVTVAGAAATLVAEDSDGSNPDQSRAALYRVTAPSASSGTVSVSFAATPGGAGVTIGIWRVKGLASQTPTATLGAPSGTLNVSEDGVVIGNSSSDNASDKTLTGVTEDYDTTRHAGGSADGIDANASYAVASTTAGSTAGAWGAWR